ncbi:MAG: hypothetical protein ABIO70_36545 [Pseudomonadota bacterium]
MRPWFCLTLAPLLGCNPDNEFVRRTYIDTFFQEARAEVDILWVVDNSESMEAEQTRLARRFDTFVEYMDEVETLMDFHLGVVTTDMSGDNTMRGRLLGDPAVLSRDVEGWVDLFKQRVQVGIEGSGMEQGIEASWAALSEPLVSDVNAGFLRRDAMLVLIYVSDENDCSDRGTLPSEDYCYLEAYQDDLIQVPEYVDGFRAIKGDPELVVSFAIVGPQDTSSCEDTLPSVRYMEMASSLGGKAGSICSEDFAGILDDLGLSVSGVRESFPLSYAAVEDTLAVWVCEEEPCNDETGVQVQTSAESGWTYDSETTYLTFHGEAVPARGAVITVKYQVAGEAADHTGIEE